jgi:peptidyl-prolyl cis-trans isomerase C
VATVGAREITRRELQVEMGGSVGSTPAAQKAAQQAALQRIIQRVILANEAKVQGLNKDPNFALLSQRGDEALLGHLLETKMAGSVPPPSPEEVEQFQQTNPNLFAERKIFDLNQIRLPRPSDPDFVKKMEPIKTLDEVANFLNQNHIAYQRGANTMDSTYQNPKLLAAILALQPHEVFLLSSESEVFINEIRDTRISPLVGPTAAIFAMTSLKSQHMQEAVERQLMAIVTKARGSVHINSEFIPAKAPAKKPEPK